MSENERWTEERVRGQRPDVPVLMPDGSIQMGWVRGTLLPFAVIYLRFANSREASWTAIVECLNTKQPLVY